MNKKLKKLEKAYKEFHKKMGKLAERQQDVVDNAVKKIEKKQLKKLSESVK